MISKLRLQQELLFVTAAVMFLLCFTSGMAQKSDIGYVIEKKDNKVYIDLGNKTVKPGDRLKVIKEGGIFIHPVSRDSIREEDEIVSYIEIVDVKEKYSISSVNEKSAYEMVQVGMKVFTLNEKEALSKDLRKSVIVQPLTVTNVQGYLGLYIDEILTGQLLTSDRFRILDRNTIGIKNEELLLSANGLVSESEFLNYSNAKNADYFISGTMYEPDVVEVSSGVPVKSLVNLAGMAVTVATGKDMSMLHSAAEYLPDKTEFKNVRAIVKISLKLIDVKTGEILFICTEMQEAKGRSEINMEGGVLNGLKVRGGAATFGNTVTGEATKKCMQNLMNYIFQYVDGRITVKNYSGNNINLSNREQKGQILNATNQLVIMPTYKPIEETPTIGMLIGENDEGESVLEYFRNSGMEKVDANRWTYFKFESNTIYEKVFDMGSLNRGDTIFVFKSSGITYGKFLTSQSDEIVRFEFQRNNIARIGTAPISEVYSVKKGMPAHPYLKVIQQDSIYHYFYGKENRIVEVKVISNLNSLLMSQVEFTNNKGVKVFLNCSNRDLYFLNERYEGFELDEIVYFQKPGRKGISGTVIGFDPIKCTLRILYNNLGNGHTYLDTTDIFFRDVSKNKP